MTAEQWFDKWFAADFVTKLWGDRIWPEWPPLDYWAFVKSGEIGRYERVILHETGEK